MIRPGATMTLALLLSLTILFDVTSFASPTPERDARLAEKVKRGIAKLGVGQSTRLTVKLRDKREIAGYISEIGDSGFVMTVLTAEPSTVAYSDVVQVKGNNLSTGAKVAIGVGIIAGVIIVLYLVRGAFCDGC